MRWREAECGPGYDEDRWPMEHDDWRPPLPETRARAERLRREVEAVDGDRAPWSTRHPARRVSRHRTIGRGYRPGSRGYGVSGPRRWLAHERRFDEGRLPAGEREPRRGRYGPGNGEDDARRRPYRTRGGEYGPRPSEYRPPDEYVWSEDYGVDYDLPARRRSAQWRSRLAEWYDEEFRRGPRRPRREAPLFPEELIERYRPHKAVGRFSARGIHTYDLDYGRQAGGPTTEYSGRAGLPTDEPVRTGETPLESAERSEWPYTPEPEPVEDEEPSTRGRPRYERWHWSMAEPADRRPRRRRWRSDRG